MKISKFIITLILISLYGLINTTEVIPKNNETIEINFGDKIFATVPPKEFFTIKVKGNCTTGFLTFIKNYNSIAVDEKHFEFLDIEYDNTVNLYKSKDYEIIHPDIDGGDGYSVFKIKALKPLDDIKLEFITIKPWEIKSKNAQSFISSVTMTTTDLFYLD